MFVCVPPWTAVDGPATASLCGRIAAINAPPATIATTAVRRPREPFIASAFYPAALLPRPVKSIVSVSRTAPEIGSVAVASSDATCSWPAKNSEGLKPTTASQAAPASSGAGSNTGQVEPGRSPKEKSSGSARIVTITFTVLELTLAMRAPLSVNVPTGFVPNLTVGGVTRSTSPLLAAVLLDADTRATNSAAVATAEILIGLTPF